MTARLAWAEAHNVRTHEFTEDPLELRTYNHLGFGRWIAYVGKSVPWNEDSNRIWSNGETEEKALANLAQHMGWKLWSRITDQEPDMAERIHRGLYKKSDNPEHPDNRDSREFLDGYAGGITRVRQQDNQDEIHEEYIRRGEPKLETKELERFREWKRGFHAGSIRESLTRIRTSHAEKAEDHSPSTHHTT